MDDWEKGSFAALVDDTICEIQRLPQRHRANDDESIARSFNSKVLSGRLRSAVHQITNREAGGVLQPLDLCTKTNTLVVDVLASKHPPLRLPPIDDSIGSVFESYDSVPEPLPLIISADLVAKTVTKLAGSGGPSGTDAVDLQNWLLRFGASSTQLRETMASLTEWLANTHPPWAAYRALMACRLVALDKCPGVRPVGVGEVYRRLMAKCVVAAVAV